MKFFEGKASELTVLQLVLVLFVTGGLAILVFGALKNAITTKNIVELPNGRKFVATSWFGPMSTSAYDKYAGDKVKALADAAKKETEKA